MAQYRRRILIHSARIKHHLFKQKAIVSGHYKHKYHHPSHLPDEPVQHFLLHILIKAVPGKLLSVMFCPKLGETKRFPPILNHMGRKISWVAHDFCQSKLPKKWQICNNFPLSGTPSHPSDHPEVSVFVTFLLNFKFCSPQSYVIS